MAIMFRVTSCDRIPAKTIKPFEEGRIPQLQICPNPHRLFRTDKETTAHRCASTAELQAGLQKIQANLTTIYTEIRDVDHYQGLLVALTYYSLSYSDPNQVAGTKLLDSVIASVTTAFGGKVADGFAAFQGPSAAFGGSPCAAGLLIKLPDGTCNIHPSPAGHLLLAKAIEDVVGTLPPK